MSGYHRLIVRAEARPVVYEGMRTPWGVADNAKVVAPGIGWVGTPGHGGVKLSPAMNRRMPDHMRQRGGWYEEDCDWSLPYAFFADALRAAGESEQALADAMPTLRNWHPAAYEQFTGEEIPEGESHIKDKRIFSDRHANDLVAVSAINSSERPGMVEVTATVGGVRSFGGARRFLVPEEEYDTRGILWLCHRRPGQVRGARRARRFQVGPDRPGAARRDMGGAPLPPRVRLTVRGGERRHEAGLLGVGPAQGRGGLT